jgi:hypothetical protein
MPLTPATFLRHWFEQVWNAGRVELVDTGMDEVCALGIGFYDAAAGVAAPDGRELDPVQQFVVEDWIAELERSALLGGPVGGASGWSEDGSKLPRLWPEER